MLVESQRGHFSCCSCSGNCGAFNCCTNDGSCICVITEMLTSFSSNKFGEFSSKILKTVKWQNWTKRLFSALKKEEDCFFKKLEF